jgi:hypothetical protein
VDADNKKEEFAKRELLKNWVIFIITHCQNIGNSVRILVIINIRRRGIMK